MLKKKRIKPERGYALVTAMVMGIVAMSITAAVIFRISNSSSQIVQRETKDEALALGESVMTHVMDTIAEISQTNTCGNGALTSSCMGILKTATQISQDLHSSGNDWIGVSNQADSQLVFSRPPSLPSGKYQQYFSTSANSTFFNSFDSNVNHSSNFWNTFKHIDNQQIGSSLNLDLGGGNTISNFSINNLHNSAYSIYRVKRVTGKKVVQADVLISVVPLATNILGKTETELHPTTDAAANFINHRDVMKIRTVTYVPGINNPKQTKVLDMIVNRPAISEPNPANDYTFAHALLAGGDVSMGNWDTSAGPTAASIDTAQSGDVHVNGDITFGPNGAVQGKVTASGTVDISGTILPTTEWDGVDTTDPRNGIPTTKLSNREQSRSGADEQTIPDFKVDNLPTAACPAVSSSAVVRMTNCKISGTLNLPNSHYEVEFEGTVWITGSMINKGSVRCVGSVPCRIVVDETVDHGGNADTNFNSEQESLYIVRNTGSASTCLDIGGTPGASGDHGNLYYISDPNCDTTLRGNSEFFGGIITRGGFTGSGNATNQGIQRDSDMDALRMYLTPLLKPLPKRQLYPGVISWKDLRQ